MLYSRDVKFYETIFPYKMKQTGLSDSHLEVNTLNFFDSFESKTRTPSPFPNDETSDVASVGREGSLDQSGRVVDDVQDLEPYTLPLCSTATN